MKEPSLLARLAVADARYRQALQQIVAWQDEDESHRASLLFLRGVTEKAREELPAALYSMFEDAAEASAELRRLEEELRRFTLDTPCR